MGKLKDLVGQKFGRWTVVSFAERRKKCSYWNCVCECGKEKIVSHGNFKKGISKSCGCFKKENPGSKTHGLTRTAEYQTWLGFKKRCNNPKNKGYKNYGGRGIIVCDRWLHSFENFFEDMGYRPSPKHSLDRIENNKGYYKENCRWATRKEQNNNQRSNVKITFKNTTLNIAQWADTLNINASTIRARIRKGWGLEKAVSHPVRKNNRVWQ